MAECRLSKPDVEGSTPFTRFFNRVDRAMRYNDLLQLYFQRSSALQWYWTIYVVVIGGLLAFSSLRQRPDFRTAILVTILYCFFAYKNLGAIADVTFERFAILDSIKSYLP